MKKNVIFDLDGTLADLTHRLHHIKQSPKNWDLFHSSCSEDKPRQAEITLIQLFYCHGFNLWILSGRNEAARDQTIMWLEEHNVLYHYLLMREANDRRDDTIIKAEMAEQQNLTPENTLCIFDDRQKVVDMWRAKGFACMQVQAWKE